DEGGAQSERRAVGWVRRVGEALAEVHRAGLLHLDVKPENIIVTPAGRVALVDFDASREAREFAAVRAERLVTPGYAPFEQYVAAARLGPHTDLYALAATLYCLLAGEAPPAAPDRVRGVVLRPLRERNPRV